MKKYILFISIIFLLVSACSETEERPKQLTDNTLNQRNYSETEKLVYYIEKYGNYINSANTPSLITQEEAFKNIGNSRYHYIDLRSKEDFITGHVSRAYQVDFENLLNYIENKITASHYDKIILLCKAGQSSSYATGLLRILGYSNVYSLKWGMSAWNRDFSSIWLSNISGNFKSNFDTIKVDKHPSSDLPVINTGKLQPEEILYARVSELFSRGLKDFKISRDKMLEHAKNYYIVDYIDEYKYNILHLSGSIQYQPKKSLLSSNVLRTLPNNQAIVVHCLSGHNSAFVVAYLRILGYEAKSLVFGRNGMIYETVKNKGWTAFTKEFINDYNYISGEKTIEPKSNNAVIIPDNKEEDSNIPLPVNTKKDKNPIQGGCG